MADTEETSTGTSTETTASSLKITVEDSLDQQLIATVKRDTSGININLKKVTDIQVSNLTPGDFFYFTFEDIYSKTNEEWMVLEHLADGTTLVIKKDLLRKDDGTIYKSAYFDTTTTKETINASYLDSQCLLRTHLTEIFKNQMFLRINGQADKNSGERVTFQSTYSLSLKGDNNSQPLSTEDKENISYFFPLSSHLYRDYYDILISSNSAPSDTVWTVTRCEYPVNSTIEDKIQKLSFVSCSPSIILRDVECLSSSIEAPSIFSMLTFETYSIQPACVIASTSQVYQVTTGNKEVTIDDQTTA